MTGPEMDELVEMANRVYQRHGMTGALERAPISDGLMRAILTAVLPRVLQGPREALEIFALRSDQWEPGEPDDNRQVRTVPLGDCRRARSELSRLNALLPDDKGEG